MGRVAQTCGGARVRQELERVPRGGGGAGRGDVELKIAVLSPVWFPVPPPRYGGIEWIVALLADGLVERGHDVTLFASGDSSTKAELASVFEAAPSEFIGATQHELHHALDCLEKAAEFDIVNDHSGPLAAALGAGSPTPVVHTVHGPLNRRAGELYEQIDRFAPRVGLISLSMNQRSPLPHLNWVANCPNALDLSLYPVHPHKGDYLLFIGRMSPDKGAHRAIEVAEEVGLPLKLAGKMQELREEEYFEAAVKPHLGGAIEYLGEVSHEEKVDLLQNARVTLFPIEWAEPFGLVMIESMACGTPVIATRHGAVPEVIEDGHTGVIVEEHAQMAGVIEQADAIDPLECRRYVEERFSKERMVADYEGAYMKALESAPAPTG